MKTIEIHEIGSVVYWFGISDGVEVPVADEVIGVEVTPDGILYTLNDYGKIEDSKVYPSYEKCEEVIAFEIVDEINNTLKEKVELLKRHGISVEIITPPRNITDTRASVDSSTDTSAKEEHDDYTNPIIGHVYEIEGIKCKCVEIPVRKDCSGCVINQCISSWSTCDYIRCSHRERNDRKNVYFVEVDK